MKQATTNTIIMRPMVRLMTRVTVLPIRNPAQCITVKTPITAMAMARGHSALAGHSVAMNTDAVRAA